MIVRYIGAPVSPDNDLITSVFPPEREAAKHIFSGKHLLVSYQAKSEYKFENCSRMFNQNLFKEVPGANIAYKYSLLINTAASTGTFPATTALWFPYMLNDAALQGWIESVNKLRLNVAHIVLAQYLGSGVVRLDRDMIVEVLEMIERMPERECDLDGE